VEGRWKEKRGIKSSFVVEEDGIAPTKGTVYRKEVGWIESDRNIAITRSGKPGLG